MRKKIAAAVAVTALTLSACGGGGGADFVTIAAGGTSGPYYVIGASMSKVFSEKLGAESSVQATGASVENVNLIADGKAEMAFAMGDATRQAMDGTGPFKDNAHTDLVAMTALYPNFVQIITTEQSGIKSVADLKGKRVGVGDSGSGVELNAQMILEAHGMNYDDINEDFLSYAEAIDQMKNGQVDAAFVTSGLPNSAVTDLATTHDVKVVPFEGDGLNTLLEYEFFGEGTVPKDTYDSKEDAATVTIPNLLLASPELSEDAVYDITKTIFDNLDQVHATHNAAKDITLENAPNVVVTELHPGAKRYFDEAGTS